MYRDRAERAQHRKMDFYAKEVERMDLPRRVSLEPEPSNDEKHAHGESIVNDNEEQPGTHARFQT